MCCDVCGHIIMCVSIIQWVRVNIILAVQAPYSIKRDILEHGAGVLQLIPWAEPPIHSLKTLVERPSEMVTELPK